MSIDSLAIRSFDRYLWVAVIFVSCLVGILIFEFDWQLAAVFVLLGSVVIAARNVRTLTFICVLLLFFNQTHISIIRDYLEKGRWIPLLTFAVFPFLGFMVNHRLRRFQRFDLLIVGFIIYAFISSLFSVDASSTLGRTITLLLLYIAIFRVLWNYAESYDKINDLIDVILKAAFFVYPACFIWLAISPESAFLRGRFRGVMENPNSLGILTAILLPLALWRAYETKKKLHIALTAAMFVALIMTGSRAALVASVLAVGYFLFYVFKKKRVLVVIAGGLLISLAMLIPNRDYRTEQIERYYRFQTLATGSGRVEARDAAIELIKEKPIFGYGFGTEDLLFDRFGVEFREHQGKYVHNSYLGLALQLGLLGAVMFFVPLGIFFFKSLLGGEKNSMLEHALLGVLIAGFVDALFESWIYSVGNSQAFPFWMSVMLLMRLRHQDLHYPPKVAGGRGQVPLNQFLKKMQRLPNP